MEKVLFDLDGTLIDTERRKEEILRECTELLGLPPISGNEYLEVHFEILRGSHVETRYEIFRKILKNKGVREPNRKARDLKREFRTKSLLELEILDDAYSVLDELSCSDLCLVSNGPRLTQWEKIEKFNLEDYFDVIVISGEVGVSKPDPEIFWHALDPAERDEAVLVGDSRLNDVKGAQNIGISSILVKGRSTEKSGPKADWEVENLRDILEIIEMSTAPP